MGEWVGVTHGAGRSHERFHVMSETGVWRQQLLLLCVWRQRLLLICVWRQRLLLLCVWRQRLLLIYSLKGRRKQTCLAKIIVQHLATGTVLFLF